MSGMKRFGYFESTEGGMEFHLILDRGELRHLYGWMTIDCVKADLELQRWMDSAQVGEHFEHRLGVCVRLIDFWGAQ